MSCLITDRALVGCCPPPPPTGPMSDGVMIHTVAYGFCGKHLHGEKWRLYKRVEVEKKFNGFFYNTGAPIIGTKRITAVANDRLEDYTSSVTEDADWIANKNTVFFGYLGAGETVRHSATSWEAQGRWQNPFSDTGTIDCSWIVSDIIDIDPLILPLFAQVDSYSLSPTPVATRQAIFHYYPLTGELIPGLPPPEWNTANVPINVAHLPPDGAIASMNSNKFSATLGYLPRRADGVYDVAFWSGAREVPWCLGLVLGAGKSIEWNPYLVCQLQQLSQRSDITGFPVTTDANESCGMIGSPIPANNVAGVAISRPDLSFNERQPIVRGLIASTRQRLIYYKIPGQPDTSPVCCGFPP